MVEKRYRALRIFGTVLKVFGAIAGVLTLISVIGLCLSSVLGGAAFANLSRDLRGPMGPGFGIAPALAGALAAGFALFNGALIAVSLYGSGELIFLLLGLEENTREIANLLRER